MGRPNPHTHFAAYAAAAALAMITGQAEGQQVPLPTSPAEVPGPRLARP